VGSVAVEISTVAPGTLMGNPDVSTGVCADLDILLWSMCMQKRGDVDRNVNYIFPLVLVYLSQKLIIIATGVWRML